MGAGDRGGRSDILARSPAGHRYNDGVSSQDGTARPRAANHDGAVLEVARRRKEATYPELPGENGRARPGGLCRQGWRALEQ